MRNIQSIANIRDKAIYEVIELLRDVALATNGTMNTHPYYYYDALLEAIDCGYLDHNLNLCGEYYYCKEVENLELNNCY